MNMSIRQAREKGATAHILFLNTPIDLIQKLLIPQSQDALTIDQEGRGRRLGRIKAVDMGIIEELHKRRYGLSFNNRCRRVSSSSSE
jgi:hypothetical protein